MSNFKEIENEMLRNKSIIRVNNANDFLKKIEECINGNINTKKIGINAKRYVLTKSTILEKTIRKIQIYLT